MSAGKFIRTLMAFAVFLVVAIVPLALGVLMKHGPAKLAGLPPEAYGFTGALLICVLIGFGFWIGSEEFEK